MEMEYLEDPQLETEDRGDHWVEMEDLEACLGEVKGDLLVEVEVLRDPLVE